MNYFPNNTLTHYTTKLPKITDLDRAWKIGLAEIQYAHSWYIVMNNEAWLKVHFYKESELQKAFGFVTGWVLFLGQKDSPSRGKSTWRNSRINSTWVSMKSIIKSIWKWKKIVKSSSVLYYNPCQDSDKLYFEGVCFRLGSGPQERIKFSVLVLSLGGTENGGRCPNTVIENRTGGRMRRRNDHPSVWSDTVLSPVTTTISDSGNRYKGRHGLYSAIRKRTSGGDTSL